MNDDCSGISPLNMTFSRESKARCLMRGSLSRAGSSTRSPRYHPMDLGEARNDRCRLPGHGGRIDPYRARDQLRELEFERKWLIFAMRQVHTRLPAGLAKSLR